MPSVMRALVWLRRDLRLDDNVALRDAAAAADQVVCAFVLDPVLLHSDRVGAPIVQSFFTALAALRERLRALGSDLLLLQGDFGDELLAATQRLAIDAVYFNRDTDPSAIARDTDVSERLRAAGVRVESRLDQVYFGPEEIVQKGGAPYLVFTPYRRRWEEARRSDPRMPVDSEARVRSRLLPSAAIGPSLDVPAPETFGHASSPAFPSSSEGHARALLDRFLDGAVADYSDARNFPAVPGTSHLSPHLRAGTIGIRTCVERALATLAGRPAHAQTAIRTWISELIWRDFYQQILAHFPNVAQEPFLERARGLQYRDDPDAFRAWTRGETGYPIVDAAMVQLNTRGWMHNRLRMVVASFLTKHLLLDYRLGERYFEQHLADADLAANNGGWQWASSTGTDAAPYFRIFNPTLQGKTFDPEGCFVREMLPALARVPDAYIHEPWKMPPLIAAEAGVTLGVTYPVPIVDHAEARARALSLYQPVLGRAGGVSPKRRSVKT